MDNFLTTNFPNFGRNKNIMKLTFVIKKGKSGFLVGQLKEFPEVFTQGKDIQELRENIQDALEMYFEDVN